MVFRKFWGWTCFEIVFDFQLDFSLPDLIKYISQSMIIRYVKMLILAYPFTLLDYPCLNKSLNQSSSHTLLSPYYTITPCNKYMSSKGTCAYTRLRVYAPLGHIKNILFPVTRRSLFKRFKKKFCFVLLSPMYLIF